LTEPFSEFQKKEKREEHAGHTPYTELDGGCLAANHYLIRTVLLIQ